MACVLITGMSGTGKSSVIDALAARGYSAVDIDDARWIRLTADGHELWDEERVQAFLDEHADDRLAFLAGCADNQVAFYPQFACIVLLSAPTKVILHRLGTRTNNPYGKSAEERAEVLRYIQEVEPFLRRGAQLEIDTTAPLEEVVARVIEAASNA